MLTAEHKLVRKRTKDSYFGCRKEKQIKCYIEQKENHCRLNRTRLFFYTYILNGRTNSIITKRKKNKIKVIAVVQVLIEVLMKFSYQLNQLIDLPNVLIVL